MKKNILVAVFAAIFAIMILAGGVFIGISFEGAKNYFTELIGPAAGNTAGVSDSSDYKTQGDPGIGSIEETINYIMANSINKKTKKELVDAAIEGILASLDDRYADYFPADEYKKIIDSYSGTMSGIGVIVTTDEDGSVIVVNVIEGTPASEEGLAEGDIITAVGSVEIKDMALDKVVAMIKGEEGTDVNITIFRPSENSKIDFTITRRRFYVPNFTAGVIEENILYVQYWDFQENGAKNLGEKLEALVDGGAEKPVKGMILDLRNNLGGTLNDAVELCDLFLDSGVIVTVKGRSDNADSFEKFEATGGGFTSLPVIVLINGYSASASELAAGALKDLGRAVLVGEKSFGKGTVQILNELPDGSGIKYTTAKYYLPSGVSIDGVGIEPDITVALAQEDEEDLQLKRAIEEIRNMIVNQI